MTLNLAIAMASSGELVSHLHVLLSGVRSCHFFYAFSVTPIPAFRKLENLKSAMKKSCHEGILTNQRIRSFHKKLAARACRDRPTRKHEAPFICLEAAHELEKSVRDEMKQQGIEFDESSSQRQKCRDIAIVLTHEDSLDAIFVGVLNFFVSTRSNQGIVNVNELWTSLTTNARLKGVEFEKIEGVVLHWMLTCAPAFAKSRIVTGVKRVDDRYQFCDGEQFDLNDKQFLKEKAPKIKNGFLQPSLFGTPITEPFDLRIHPFGRHALKFKALTWWNKKHKRRCACPNNACVTIQATKQSKLQEGYAFKPPFRAVDSNVIPNQNADSSGPQQRSVNVAGEKRSVDCKMDDEKEKDVTIHSTNADDEESAGGRDWEEKSLEVSTPSQPRRESERVARRRSKKKRKRCTESRDSDSTHSPPKKKRRLEEDVKNSCVATGKVEMNQEVGNVFSVTDEVDSSQSQSVLTSESIVDEFFDRLATDSLGNLSEWLDMMEALFNAETEHDTKMKTKIPHQHLCVLHKIQQVAHINSYQVP